MEGATLPLTFYCRNAQLCLANATEAQKSGFVGEELQQLKTFSTLVSEIIPAHPNFQDRLEDGQLLELNSHLPEVAELIRELEDPNCEVGTCTGPQFSICNNKSSRNSKPPLAAPATSSDTCATEGRNVLLEHSEGNCKMGVVRTNNAVVERRFSENSEERPECSGAEYDNDISVHHCVKLGYHETKGEQLHAPRGTGLREWRGNFATKSKRETGGLAAGEVFEGSCLASNSQSRRRQEEAGNRPSSEPRIRRPTMAPECKPKESSGVVPCESIVKHGKPAFLAPRVQREAPGECERFRRHMRLLKEKAKGSRSREEEVQGLAVKPQRRWVDRIELVTDDATYLRRTGKYSSRDNGDKGKVMARREKRPHSSPVSKFRGGHLFEMQEGNPGGAESSSRKSQCAAASNRSTPTFLNSLPLSHYSQKLRSFTLDPHQGAAVVESFISENNTIGSVADRHEHHEKFICEDTRSLPFSHELEQGVGLCSTSLPFESASAIFSTSGTNSSSPGVLPRSSPQLANRRFGLSSSSALFASLAHPNELGTSQPELSQSNTSNIAFGSGSELENTIAREDKDTSYHMVTTLDDQLSYPPFLSDLQTKMSLEMMGETMNNMQRALGELKGSVQCIKVRFDVDGQGWRGHLDRLENELENLKDKSDDEILAAKHSLRNEMKVKLGDVMAEIERTRREERNEVEAMVERMVERMLQSQKYTKSSAEMKDEIRRLWFEVDALVKSRKETEGHVELLTSAAKKAQEHVNREHDMLKSENGYLRKQLQALKNEGVQARLVTENFRLEKEDLRLTMDKLKGEGSDTKLEIQGLKKVEKLVKADLENIRKGLAKLQEETQDLERQNEELQAGSRERMLIMERVESLSQRYLGGLEEVRKDVLNIKFDCRDRLREYEKESNNIRSQQLEASNLASKQMLRDELDHFRADIVEIVDIERGLVRQILDRESEIVKREVKDLLFSSKAELVNVVKLDVQKWLQDTHERIFLLNEALKRDLDTCINELGRTQEGAEDLMQMISAAESQREIAIAAAADASRSATKASNVLMDVSTSINNEMMNTHHRMKQLEEKLAAEKEFMTLAIYEARKMSYELQKEKEAALIIVKDALRKQQEMQDLLESENSRSLTAYQAIQSERGTASQAASDATSSAMKAKETMAEILHTYEMEMAKVRHTSALFQEILEKERVELEHERELAVKNSHNAHNCFRQEFEVAFSGWKQTMDDEITRVKELTIELEKEMRRRGSYEQDQLSQQLSPESVTAQSELGNHISKTEEPTSGFAALVKEVQDCKVQFCKEKKRRRILKQQEKDEKEQHWNGKISRINKIVQVVEKRVRDTCGDHAEMRKKVKKCEGAHVGLVHIVEDVRLTTSEIAKAVSSWLPRYKAAARFVNDLFCKVERAEEKFDRFTCDEGLAQRFFHIAETKIGGLKDHVSSNVVMENIGQDLRDLYERVENIDRIHCQSVGEVASRLAVLERSINHVPGQPVPGLSLRVEYTDSAEARRAGLGSSSQSLEALEKKMELMTEHTGALVGGQESANDAALLGLERRIEHIASATFSNLSLLDSKIDRVSLGTRSAVEGAALAESKCGALGLELVKVFRMLTRSNRNGSGSTKSQLTNKSKFRRLRQQPPSINSLNPQLGIPNQSPQNPLTMRTKCYPRFIFSPKKWPGVRISHIRPKTTSGSTFRGLSSTIRAEVLG